MKRIEKQTFESMVRFLTWIDPFPLFALNDATLPAVRAFESVAWIGLGIRWSTAVRRASNAVRRESGCGNIECQTIQIKHVHRKWMCVCVFSFFHFVPISVNVATTTKSSSHSRYYIFSCRVLVPSRINCETHKTEPPTKNDGATRAMRETRSRTKKN